MSKDKQKLLEKLKSQLEYWENYSAGTNFGKWGKSLKIDGLKTQIKEIESETKIIKLKK